MKKYSKDDLVSSTPSDIKINIPIWPVGSFKSLGEFGAGDARHGGKHDGIDLAAPKGTAVYPMLPGIVKKVDKESRSWKEGLPKQGNAILIEHPDFGLVTFYAHLESVSVSVGETVDQKTIIGTVGNSGNARDTSPHVHFETRKGGAPKDPRGFMGKPAEMIAGKKSITENPMENVMAKLNKFKKIATNENKRDTGDIAKHKTFTREFNSLIEDIKIKLNELNIKRKYILEIIDAKEYAIREKNSRVFYETNESVMKMNKLTDLIQKLYDLIGENIIVENFWTKMNLLHVSLEKINKKNYKMVNSGKDLIRDFIPNPVIADITFTSRNKKATEIIQSLIYNTNDFIEDITTFFVSIYNDQSDDLADFDNRLLGLSRKAKMRILKLLNKIS